MHSVNVLCLEALWSSNANLSKKKNVFSENVNYTSHWESRQVVIALLSDAEGVHASWLISVWHSIFS